MLSDLNNALEKKPFQEPEFDDVYSKSITESDEDENVLIPEIESDSGCVEYTTPVLSIREEVQIPDVDPVYKVRKSGKPIKKAVSNEKIPEIKSTTVKRNPDSKKVIITAIIALIMIVLFLLSVVLHNYAKSDDTIIAQVSVLISEGIFNGGVLYNGC